MTAGVKIDFDAAGDELYSQVTDMYQYRDTYFSLTAPLDADTVSQLSSVGADGGQQAASVAERLLAIKNDALKQRVSVLDEHIVRVYCSCRKKKRQITPASSAVAAIAASTVIDGNAEIPDIDKEATSSLTETASEGKLDHRLTMKQKARYFFLRGHLHNVLPEHSAQAEHWLEKSIKLEPGYAHPWNSLGESYWKLGDMQNSKLCFETALQYVCP